MPVRLAEFNSCCTHRSGFALVCLTSIRQKLGGPRRQLEEYMGQTGKQQLNWVQISLLVRHN